MMEQFGRDGLPNDVRYGDGAVIEDATVDAIALAYQAARAEVVWQRGDVLLVDNTIAAHGRTRFTGPRVILVAFAGATTWGPVPEWI